MRHSLFTISQRLANWLRPKNATLPSDNWPAPASLDAYRRHRKPTAQELVNELKNTAFTCATINASVCASFPPKLYVTTTGKQPAPKCPTRPLTSKELDRLYANPKLQGKLAPNQRIEEVIAHPFVALINHVNSFHSTFDLWEYTTLYQEILGHCYWLLEFDALRTPTNIWILPSQYVRPFKRPNSRNAIDGYEYFGDQQKKEYSVEEIVHFRYPDPSNPYLGGLSPLQACYQQVAMTGEYLAFKRSTWDNAGIPGAVLSPDEVVGEDERRRLETEFRQKFTRGGNGKLLIPEYGMKLQILQHSMGDLAALAEYDATVKDICNAFHVPLSFLSTETNLANLTAAEAQHMRKAVRPRLQRRDEKINERIIPLFDDSGRLFVASPDPVPENQEMRLKQQEHDLKYGMRSINEIRAERGELPVEWGEKPWLPGHWIQTDQPRLNSQLITTDDRDEPNKE